MIKILRALVGAVDAAGKSIFAGKRFTGFSNAEEDAIGDRKVIPHHHGSISEFSCQIVGNSFPPRRQDQRTWWPIFKGS